ncbi:MAG: FAD-dependent monooxygenase [Actinobacteria bacterium]|nr:FAD-dependent monooxygenase [Actinomycetota bacterium]
MSDATETEDLPSEVDVLVVGAGPVGLTAARLLERLGRSVAVVERRPGPQRAPAAHVVNARTFEIWRQAGLDVDGLRALAVDPADGGEVHWVTRLGGEVLGSLPFEQQGDHVLAVTPTPLRNLSQHHVEPLLARALAEAGVAVRYGATWCGAEQDDGGVTSHVATAAGTQAVRSRWLLGCDGAGSPVRRSVGIEPEGPHHLQRFVMVHLAADLRAVVGDRPGVLFWICDPRAGGAFVAHDIDREWVYMHPFDPDQDPVESYTPARCEAIVRAAMADREVPLEVLAVSTWTMTAQVAERYRAGRVLLVGDAAHRFPPTGGMGLNTGVADAHNLAWKLAADLAETAPADLVDTYESERRPVAVHNATVSLENALKLVEVPLALGVSDDVEASAAAAEATLADPEGRRRVAAAIAAQATHFDMLGLQLGYEYDLGPDADDADDAGDGGGDEAAGVDPVRAYVPSSRPGARLPHGWVTHRGRRCSSLDLVPLDRLVLIAGPACDRPDADLRVGIDVEDPDGWWSDTLRLPVEGSILVRPDQHVAARWRRSPSADHTS